MHLLPCNHTKERTYKLKDIKVEKKYHRHIHTAVKQNHASGIRGKQLALQRVHVLTRVLCALWCAEGGGAGEEGVRIVQGGGTTFRQGGRRRDNRRGTGHQECLRAAHAKQGRH